MAGEKNPDPFLFHHLQGRVGNRLAVPEVSVSINGLEGASGNFLSRFVVKHSGTHISVLTFDNPVVELRRNAAQAIGKSLGVVQRQVKGSAGEHAGAHISSEGAEPLDQCCTGAVPSGGDGSDDSRHTSSDYGNIPVENHRNSSCRQCHAAVGAPELIRSALHRGNE